MIDSKVRYYFFNSVERGGQLDIEHPDITRMRRIGSLGGGLNEGMTYNLPKQKKEDINNNEGVDEDELDVPK